MMEGLLEMLPDWKTLVTVLGLIPVLSGLMICLWLCSPRRLRPGLVAGVAGLSGMGLYKLLAFGGLVAAPAVAVGVANYHVFEGVKSTDACMACHVMRPMGHDMIDPASRSLAARHYANGSITRNHCYECHTDYGFSGTIRAKMDGYRHLARYTTGTYSEPIHFRGTYANRNCLDCHEGTVRFESVDSHQTVRDRLLGDEISCTNCHGPAHPTRDQRTPGHGDYEKFVRAWEKLGP